jgi:hypothetical protein
MKRGAIMSEFKVGDKVYFYHNDQLCYRRIVKISYTEDGLMAIFDEGCVRKALKKQLTEIFYTIEELRKELTING